MNFYQKKLSRTFPVSRKKHKWQAPLYTLQSNLLDSSLILTDLRSYPSVLGKRYGSDQAGFSEGVLNAHHGPLLNFPGVLTEIQDEKYRDLHYYYGSYALSLRWIRPTRLQFWVEDMLDGGCKVIGQVDSFVKWGLQVLGAPRNASFGDSFAGGCRSRRFLRRG